MNETPNIYLIGPMGAGKSSVGRILANMTGRTFYDSDHEIMERTGVKISWIFEVEKEVGFRKREAMVIEELCQQNKIVLSTGGGSIITESTRENLKKSGIVIYLKVSLEEQVQRTKRTDTRPLLEVADPRAKLIELNTFRTPIYESLADFTINTDHKQPKKIAEEILSKIAATK